MATRLTDLTASAGTAIHDSSEVWIDEYNSETATMTSADPGVVTITSHGLVANNIVVFTTTGALPNNITAGTNYYVLATGLTSDDFQVSDTAGGVAIDTTSGVQSGTHTATYYVSRKLSGLDLKTILGNASYKETFTPGSVTVANTITHGLNTTDLVVELWDVDTNEQVFADLGNRTATTVDVTFNVNPTGNVDIVIVSSGGTVAVDARPYKVLTGIISQAGTGAPTITVLENTLGVLPVWSYVSVGNYRFTSTALFTASKTVVFTGFGSGQLGAVINWTHTANYVQLYGGNVAASYADDLFASTSFEVRVYD
jgi:hypothetical protein